MLYGQKPEDPSLTRIHLNIVRQYKDGHSCMGTISEIATKEDLVSHLVSLRADEEVSNRLRRTAQLKARRGVTS